MRSKNKLLLAIAVAALAVPALASAQQAGVQPQAPQSYGATPNDHPGSTQQDIEQNTGSISSPGNEHMARHAPLGPYPRFHSMEKHIRRSVREARRANALAPRDAHGFMAQLRRIEAEEMQIYQTYGSNLPPAEEARLQGEFTQLSQAVDQTHSQVQ